MGILNLFSKKPNNYEIFISDCEKAIISYENETLPSCKNDLINAIKETTLAARQEIINGAIPSSQYTVLINKLLANCSFDLLASGKYHIYRGMLNPMSCAPNLLSVHNESIDYALKNNLITQTEKQVDNEYLMERINSVG